MIVCKSCNTSCLKDSQFCHICGAKLEKQPESQAFSVPHMLTVKEAAQTFFQNRLSIGAIYLAVKKNKLPHVKVSSGKILLDADELQKWWGRELEKSK